jgi:hypothetical protein
MNLGLKIAVSIRTTLLGGIVLSMALCAAGQKTKESTVLNTPVDVTSSVSFVWFADEDSRFKNPITFYAVPDGNPKLHSADLHPHESWNAYISEAELGRVLERLRWSDAKWAETRRRAELKDLESKIVGDTLEIVVVSSAGTARSATRHSICERLADMDTALSNSRVLWLFQMFRVDRGCSVQGFDRSRFPTE